MPNAIQQHKQQLLLYVMVALFIVVLVAGQVFLQRSQFNYLLIWQIVLYAILYFLFKQRAAFTLKQIIVFGAIARLVTAFLMPTLSDDIYRFVWDGQLMHTGNNPLLSTPTHYLQQLPKSDSHYSYFKQLYALVNHPQYYTCYPPFMQLFFWVSAFVGGFHVTANIIIIKLLIALVDIGCMVVLAKLLNYFKLPIGMLLLYALNPSVIIEGTGNAHFEVVQVALICTAIYLILSKKFVTSAVVFGLAIITKLIPVLLLPLFVKYFGFKKGILFSCIALLVVIISFLPFITTTFLQGFSSSIGLYFQTFEFNASLYYIARKIGYLEKGFNYISVLGPMLMVRFLSIYAIIFFAWYKINKQQLVALGMIVLTLFYALSTTVHPWYIINILPFALLANRLYVVVWVGVAFLSYHAYQWALFSENIMWLLLEYITVLIFILTNQCIIMPLKIKR
jgi:hypothetical protein